MASTEEIIVAHQDSRQDTECTNEWHTGSAPSARPSAVQDGEGWQQSGARGGTLERLSRGLGWFSIGLGLAQLVAPRRLAQLIGVPHDANTQAVLRAVGLREKVYRLRLVKIDGTLVQLRYMLSAPGGKSG